jgi:hypothetical protein
VGVQYQKLVLRRELLISVCLVLCRVDVFGGCRANAHCSSVGDSVIAIASGKDLSSLFIPAALSWLLQVLVMAIVSRRSGVAEVYALTSPLGLGLIYAMLFDSGLRITTGRGVTWKDRRIYDRRGVQPPRFRTSHISNLEE